MNHPLEGILASGLLVQTTLAHVLRQRAAQHADQTAYVFLTDGASDAHSMTWGQVDARAAALAAALRERGAGGKRILLALPSGLPFIESLFACWYAGAAAVPVSLPRHQRTRHRLDRIIAHAQADFAIADDEARQRICTDDDGTGNRMVWISPRESEGLQKCEPCIEEISPASTAIIQYTSGSTGMPRGVVVTHASLLHNSAQIAQACGHDQESTIAGWLPLFHDMGLVGLVIQAAFSGARCVLMPPERFLMRPWLWLEMISNYKVCSSPAPNFAYDLCVDRVSDEQKVRLDLSGWRNALNGSEPVRARTLDRFAAAFEQCGFRRTSFFPCYGLAEATLFVTGPGANRNIVRRTTDGESVSDGENSAHIGCGQSYGGTRLAIVDPQTCEALPARSIGEIWIAGPSCAAGYWNDTQTSAATFNARLRGSSDAPSWLRTGDLGFIADEQLFITGRLRELIIIAGRNHFPVDLETAAEAAEREVVAPSAVAALSVEIDGLERLILLAEVRRELVRTARAAQTHSFDADAVRRRLRAAIAAEHDVVPHEIVLLCPGALPRTTSGKISRAAASTAYLNKTLEQFGETSHVADGN
ncbi:MAG TPA: fatty acyl-AMP ligase [Tepidisphaeraceae bacterium]|nr:fatty acyl-AMP ligase [Tepidisphaeraceae bacterium]